MGKRTGNPRGRPAGSKNAHSIVRQAKIKEAAIAIEQQLPESFKGDAHTLLMVVYKDVTQPMQLRLDAAKAAISFEKPRLASVEHKGDADNPLGIAIMSAVPRDDDQPANGHDKAAHH